MEISYIIHELESKYPLCKQEQWDHSGLQLGNIYNECKGILVCLNVDKIPLHKLLNMTVI